MYKIIKNKKLDYAIDYAIDYGESTIFLFENDWNGEKYTNSTIFDENKKRYINIDKSFKPIYKKNNDDYFELLGFLEV